MKTTPLRPFWLTGTYFMNSPEIYLLTADMWLFNSYIIIIYILGCRIIFQSLQKMFSAHMRVTGLFITSNTYLTYLCHGHLESSSQAILQYAVTCCQLLFSLLCWRTLGVSTHVSPQPSHSLLWSANGCSLPAFVRSAISDSV